MFTTSFIASILVRVFLVFPLFYCAIKHGQKFNNVEAACMVACVLIGLVGTIASSVGMFFGFMEMVQNIFVF